MVGAAVRGLSKILRKNWSAREARKKMLDLFWSLFGRYQGENGQKRVFFVFEIIRPSDTRLKNKTK